MPGFAAPPSHGDDMQLHGRGPRKGVERHEAGPPPPPASSSPEAFSSSYSPAFDEVPAPPSPPPNPCLGGPHQPFWHPPNPLAPPIDEDPAAASHSSDSFYSGEAPSAAASQTQLKPLSSHAHAYSAAQSWPCDTGTHDSSCDAISHSVPSAPPTPAHSCDRSPDYRTTSLAAAAAAVAAAAADGARSVSGDGRGGAAAAAAAAAGVPMWHRQPQDAPPAAQRALQPRHSFTAVARHRGEAPARRAVYGMPAAVPVDDAGSSGNTAASPKPPVSPPAAGLPRNVWSPPDRRAESQQSSPPPPSQAPPSHAPRRHIMRPRSVLPPQPPDEDAPQSPPSSRQPEVLPQGSAAQLPAAGQNTSLPVSTVAQDTNSQREPLATSSISGTDALTPPDLSPESSTLCSDSSQSVPLAPRHPLATPAAQLFHREFFHPEDFDREAAEAVRAGGLASTLPWNPDLPTCMESQPSVDSLGSDARSGPQPQHAADATASTSAARPPSPPSRVLLQSAWNQSDGDVALGQHPDAAGPSPFDEEPASACAVLRGGVPSAGPSPEESPAASSPDPTCRIQHAVHASGTADDSPSAAEPSDPAHVAQVVLAGVPAGTQQHSEPPLSQHSTASPAGSASASPYISPSQSSSEDSPRAPRTRHIFRQPARLTPPPRPHTLPTPPAPAPVAAESARDPAAPVNPDAEPPLRGDSGEGLSCGMDELPPEDEAPPSSPLPSDMLLESLPSLQMDATGEILLGTAALGELPPEAGGTVVSAVLLLPPRCSGDARGRPRQHGSQSPSRNPPRHAAQGAAAAGVDEVVGRGAREGGDGSEWRSRAGRSQVAEAEEVQPPPLLPFLHSRPVLMLQPGGTLALGFKERSAKRSAGRSGEGHHVAGGARRADPRRAAAAAVARAAVEAARQRPRGSGAPAAAALLQPQLPRRRSASACGRTFAGAAPALERPLSPRGRSGPAGGGAPHRPRSRSLSAGRAAAPRRVRVLSAYCSAIPPPQAEGPQRYPRLTQRGGSVMPQGAPLARHRLPSPDSSDSDGPVSAPVNTHPGACAPTANPPRPQFLHPSPQEPHRSSERRAALLAMHARAAVRNAAEMQHRRAPVRGRR